MTMDRVYRVLKIRPGEAGTAARFLAFMVVVWTGFSVGGSGVEGLLFARFGPRALPYLYIAVGVITFSWMMGMTMLLQRRDPERLLLFLPLAFAVVVLAMRGLVEARSDLVYPVLWLLMMVLWTAQGQAVWGLASTLHDTRQAKRLFPLYGAGWILGSVLGGLATRPLASWIHAENLLVIWAACLVGAFLIARTLVGSQPTHLSRHLRGRGVKSRPPGPFKELTDSLRLVRESPLLLWMAVSLALFALLYFVLTLVFAEAATERIPNADQLAGFLGLFLGVSNAIGFVTALFVANRLFARFGLVTMVLTLPLIYLAGFAVVSFTSTFLVVVAFRLMQVVWVNGVWASGWQGLFNVVSAERRHRVRAFMDGVPLQSGIVAAGLLLILADRVLAPSQVALIGMGAAAVATVAMWRARAAYGSAMVDALRAGNPEVFLSEEEPFGGYRRDPAALSVLLDGTSDPDPAIRRISMQILAETDREAVDALVGGLRDLDQGVRVAALRGVAGIGEASALPDVVHLLADPEPAVRAGAVEALAACSPPGREVRPELGPLLSDPDPLVRARAAGTLHRLSAGGDGRVVLDDMADSQDPEWRAAAVRALGELGQGLGTVTRGLADRDASVRRAAASALGGFEALSSTELLLEALGDPDTTVRDAAVETAVRFGAPLVASLVEALADTSREAGALLALSRLPDVEPTTLRGYAHGQVSRALFYHGLWRRLDPDADDRVALVRYTLRYKAVEHGVNGFRAMRRDPASVELAIENLASRDPAQRANALETLEALGEPEIARPLLAVWEDSPEPSVDPSAVLLQLVGDDDAWLRACAALAAATAGNGRVGSVLERMARTDPDPTAREAAGSALKGGPVVETVSKLPMMERVLFLRKVRLFGELTPMDLKQVAASATEHLYPDGEVIAEQGELGDELHIVVSGEIRVLLGTERESRAEVARRRHGDCVGEMAIVSEEPRMASLVAEGDVRTLSIDRMRFQRILKERPEASLAVMRVLCERLRESHAREPGTVSV
jgi:HEAT repeat protein